MEYHLASLLIQNCFARTARASFRSEARFAAIEREKIT